MAVLHSKTLRNQLQTLQEAYSTEHNLTPHVPRAGTEKDPSVGLVPASVGASAVMASGEVHLPGLVNSCRPLLEKESGCLKARTTKGRPPERGQIQALDALSAV